MFATMAAFSSETRTGFARDLDILQASAEATAHTQQGLRLTDLAGVTGREKTQLFRALARLEHEGLVVRDDASRRFMLGRRLSHFAALTVEARLLAVARPAMRRIMLQLGETVHLCIR